MTRRELLAGATALTTMAAQQGAAARPNVVLMLIDDLGYGDTGFNGCTDIATPNIDRIAREGVRLTQFSAFPLCTPSRAALLTGRSPVRHGLVYSVVRPWSAYGLPQSEVLLSQVFQRSGYQTACIGKWHLGHAHVDQLPNRRGFDHFYGHVNAEIDYYEHTKLGGIDWQRNGKSVEEKGYSTDLLVDEANRWLRGRNRAKPFFLYLPFNAVHAPMQEPPEGLTRVARIANPKRRILAAMLTHLDAGIGTILDTLDREGLKENTIVVFLSDNGGATGQGSSNGKFRGGKLTAYEGGSRVPAAIRWPGKVRPNSASDQWMTVLDVFPSLCSMCGVKRESGPPLDGVDMSRSVLEGVPAGEHPDFFVACKRNETRDRQYSLRRGQWKLVRLTDAKDNFTEALYRLDEDPAETKNRIADEADVAKRLRSELERWIKLHPQVDIDSSMNPHPGWVAPRDYAAAASSYPSIPHLVEKSKE